MPRAKRTTRTAARNTAQATVLSYETKTIIVVLLLLFVYPAGLILMWAWMRNWPIWLKLIITIPLLLVALAFFALMIFIGAILSHVRIETRMHDYQQYVTTPAPILPTSSTPSAAPSQPTY